MICFLISFVATLGPATAAGALGVMANGVWPHLRSRRQILAVQVFCSAMFALHYALLGAHTGAAMCAAGALQSLAAATLRGRWALGGVFGATIAATLAMTAATWSGLPSALALAGQSMSAFGRLQHREQAIRLAFLERFHPDRKRSGRSGSLFWRATLSAGCRQSGRCCSRARHPQLCGECLNRSVCIGRTETIRGCQRDCGKEVCGEAQR